MEFFLEAYRMRGFGLDIHASNVANLAKNVANILGCDSNNLYIGSLLHDIGKVFWPDELFTKSKLTKGDWRVIQAHPNVGYNYVQSVWPDVPPETLAIILGHHERPGGEGYPCHIEPTVPMQVVGACDVYVACRERRLYRPNLICQQEALEAIQWARPDIVEAIKTIEYNGWREVYSGKSAPERSSIKEGRSCLAK